MELIWADEFNGPARQTPDPANWGGHWGRWFHSNGEAQYYSQPPTNCQLDGNGNLAVLVKQEATPDGHTPPDPLAYTSARIQTQGLQHFSPPVRIVARMLVPNTPGLLPAFWIEGDTPLAWPGGGEIDIAEFPAHYGASKLSLNYHTPRFETTSQSGGNTGNPVLPAPYTATWHEYGVDWRADRVDWLIDGAPVATVTAAQAAGQGLDWTPFSGGWPFYVILNVAVSNNWTGPPTPASAFPQTMLVDYVRAYALI